MTNRLTHYFSIIEEILQFIDNEGINMRQKKQYADFLKATLSNHELIWLFYYGLDSNNDSLRLLFEKYSFFEKIKFQFMPVCKEIKDSLRKIELNQQDLKDKDLHDYCLLYFIQDRHSKYGEKYSIDAFNGTNKDQFLKDRVELMQQIIRE